MADEQILDLGTCPEFLLALQARPPAVVHGLALLLASCVGAALAWAALTRVNLVVRAPGRVRPPETPARVFLGGNAQGPAGGPRAQVAAVRYREGDRVSRGDVLIRLDTEHLDNEIARQQRTIQAGEEEVARLEQLERALAEQGRANRARAEAELANAQDEVRQARESQAADVRVARLALEQAEDRERRTRRLLAARAVAEEEMVQASVGLREAQEKLQRAQLPLNEGRPEILRRALLLAEKDEAVRREELRLKRAARQAEVEAARLELANLNLERKQAVLCAPQDGVVTSAEVKVGDVLERGKAVVEIAEQRGFLFEVAVPSEEVGHLRTGLPARIRLDAYDYQRYGTVAGKVVFISPDSDAAGRAGERPGFYLIRVALEAEEVGAGAARGAVKLGMTGQVEIVTERESLLRLLLKQIRRSISLG